MTKIWDWYSGVDVIFIRISNTGMRTDFKGKLEGWAGRDYKQNKTVSFENHLETGHLVVWSASP